MKKSKGNIGVKDVDKESWKQLKIMCTLDGLSVAEELRDVIIEVAKRRGLPELQKLIK